MGAARAVPLAAVQFHVQGLAAIVALWPLAAAIVRGTQPATHPAAQPRTVPAT